MMSAEYVKTYYPAVAHLESFWEAVVSFEELKEREGKCAASQFMTSCVLCSVARGYLTDCSKHPRSSPTQERTFHALRNFVFGPDVDGIPEREAVAFESVWVTAGI